VTAEIIDLQKRRANKQIERACDLTGLSPDEAALIADRTLSRHVSGRAVKDFTRVCEQTGLIDKLRKPSP
jgi:hypothetical protein